MLVEQSECPASVVGQIVGSSGEMEGLQRTERTAFASLREDLTKEVGRQVRGLVGLYFFT